MNSGSVRTSCTVAVAMVTTALLSTAGCGPTVRRDLSAVPQRQITFDDMCRMQDYFDQRNASHARRGFRAIEETSNETAATEPDEHGRMRRAVIGEGTYVVSDRSARRRLQRLLADEYTRMPAFDVTGDGVRVHVHVGWWASGEMRRLRPDRPIVLSSGDQTVELPFNPCVGEFLFGAPIYALRRTVLEAEAARARGEIPVATGASLPPVDQPLDTESPVDAGLAPSGIPGDASAPPRPVSPGG